MACDGKGVKSNERRISRPSFIAEKGENMNSKGILAIKDTKNLCYKCLKKKYKIQKINR